MAVVEDRVAPTRSGSGATTVASLARDWAQKKPKHVAFREKSFGIWQEYTWAEVWELIELANLHPRVNILQPGPGVGGHCVAVDPWFIVDASDHTPLIRTARTINDAKPEWVVKQVVDAIAGVEHQAERFAVPSRLASDDRADLLPARPVGAADVAERYSSELTGDGLASCRSLDAQVDLIARSDLEAAFLAVKGAVLA